MYGCDVHGLLCVGVMYKVCYAIWKVCCVWCTRFVVRFRRSIVCVYVWCTRFVVRFGRSIVCVDVWCTRFVVRFGRSVVCGVHGLLCDLEGLLCVCDVQGLLCDLEGLLCMCMMYKVCFDGMTGFLSWA